MKNVTLDATKKGQDVHHRRDERVWSHHHHRIVSLPLFMKRMYNVALTRVVTDNDWRTNENVIT
jgi:hypothetical protein